MLDQLSPPAAEVMTSADPVLRAQLRLMPEENEEDVLIDALAVTARRQIERKARNALVTQSFTLTLPAWPCDGIRLPRAPVQSVDAVRYSSGGGALVALAPEDFRLSRRGARAQVEPVSGWPALASRGLIEVDFTAGYGDSGADVPEDIRHAMRLQIAHLFMHREAVASGVMVEIPLGIADLLAPYRLYT